MPLVNTAIFSVVFMHVAPLDVGMPYPLFAFTGLLAWNLTASALRFATIALTTNVNLVTKVYFPREIFPVSAVAVSTVDSIVGFVVLVALMLYYRVHVTPSVMFLPIVLLVQVAFTTGVAMLLSMSNLFYRDVKYLFEVVITGWMFATSVLYPLNVDGWIGTMARLNPMTTIIDAYRTVLFRGTIPEAGSFLTVTLVSFIVLAAGWLVFHRAEFKFAETI
jgi:ABC-type polysaccharide/polyol phosphate export permease